MPLPQRTLSVVGVKFPNKGKQVPRAFEIAICQPGELIHLRPEPKNPADEHAIAVYSARDIQIGYIKAEAAPLISAMLKRGQEIRAIFQTATDWGAYIRLAFDGDTPSLPPQRDRDTVVEEYADPDPDWEPDPEWD